MENKNVIYASEIRKKYKGFLLDIPLLQIPQGFATALIGENGAGKSTLMNILSGIRLDYQGQVTYFDGTETDVERAKERIGYVGPGCYFLPNWSIRQVEEISGLLFDTFDAARYRKWCSDLGIGQNGAGKKVSKLSDGNRMKLELAAVLSRETECLLMDEPASPLDPLMRDRLCSMIRDYLAEGDGARSVFFSTHNISDMENVTDYCMILENGQIVEQGFVWDLKKKYVLVKGEQTDAEQARNILYSFDGSAYGFEGICLAERVQELAGLDVALEEPSLFQISVAVMKKHSGISVASCA